MYSKIRPSSFCFLVFTLFFSCCIHSATCSSNTESQKYFVSFTDKAGVNFDPYSYFDQHTINRRILHGIPLSEYTDRPVNDLYRKAVCAVADSFTVVSRWLNGVFLYTNQSGIEKISSLPFVSSVVKLDMPVYSTLCSSLRKADVADDLALLKFQTARMQGPLFKEKKLNGSGVRIAIFDAGFPHVHDNPLFEHIRKDNRIKATYDFVKKRDHVYDYNNHGAKVLSCIAGIYNGIDMGLATGAEFLLARTENASFEPFSEEENWLAAAEWADKNGADIINSSLGYTHRRYHAHQMDGRTSFVTKAASIAAGKGILVVNAAGNEGASDWETIVSPADGDSVLAVGGTDPYQDVHISFSSFGPTADKRLKPNVSALGQVMTAAWSCIEEASGTSFASPLVAGFAACVWQQNRSLSNMQVFKEIEKSGHLYPYFDYAHGYGIPQAGYFIDKEKKAVLPTFQITTSDQVIGVSINDRFLSFGLLPVEVQRNLYYAIRNKNGVLKTYSVLKATRKEVLQISKADYDSGDVLTVHFEGYTNELEIN